MNQQHSDDLPLTGIRVIDVATVIAAPVLCVPPRGILVPKC